MKNVLIVTDVDFWLKGAGHRTRIAALVDYLSANCNLSIVYAAPVGTYAVEALSRMQNISFFFLDEKKRLSLEESGMKFERFMKGKKFDSIIIEYIHNSFFLEYLTHETQLILDAHDIISDRSEAFRDFNYAGELFEISRDNEAKIMSYYDFVLLLTAYDIQRFNQLAITTTALLVPHPSKTVGNEIRREVKNIVFIASEYLPNVDGIKFFIENCWHKITTRFSVNLLIYGNVCRMLKAAPDQRIFLMGYVEDLKEAYHQADIIINPVRFGAGLKIKNIEALANGLPLLTSLHGSRGLDSGIGTAFLVADQPDEFIAAISDLINNYELRMKLGAQASLFIEDNFNEDRCFKPLLDVINGITAS
ncbi:glycosyltransferase [Mucilaginibacter jinjuensis]|uniref:Glycosyltransferase n=1 Tax=Mucilaginibacter jinjuensis TaxID=1176721 RepID=A0ABY7TE60_9SPHI|nr:glycosyltransferase [Mucilaginibacter jinjuensis]WCT14488.1 glycosyltransferase [Mucilaginibacter jinjuensis]